jgi:tetratricopeptide (TPR) repeat protein
MYALILISNLTNLSEIRALVYPYKEDIYLVCAILGAFGAIPVLLNLVRYLYKKTILKPSTPRDTEALVEYTEYFTKKELEKLDTPYIQRIENNIERDVIGEVTEFLMCSEQVLLISGESGLGKTRLAIEISKRINKSEKLTGDFKFNGKCLFVNLRHYKDPEDIEEKLNTELSEKTILIFDDFQYNKDSFNEVRNIAFKRNSKLIITTRPIFVEALKERIGEASIRELKLGRMDIQGILQNLEDEDLKREVEKISEGNPAIALLSLDYIKKYPGKKAKEIFQGIKTSEEFFDKIIRDFQKEYGEDFIEFLAGRELTGGVLDTDIPEKYENIMMEMERSGHIVKYESVYHLTPEILSEYLINREFFTGTILKHSFDELAKEKNGTHILDILNSILKIKDEREIYRKATEKLLVIIDELEPNTEQKKRKIKAGIAVYDGFGNLNLVTEKLGEFWTDYEVLEDGNDLLNLGSFLINVSKPYEARKCLEKAKKIFTGNHNQAGIAATIHDLAIISQDQGNYEEAVKLYNQSLKMKEELGNKSGIAITLHNLGMIHQRQGNYEEAVKKYNQSLKIAEELGNKSGIAITLHNLGRIHEVKKEYGFALQNYQRALSIFKELKSPYRQLAEKSISNLRDKMQKGNMQTGKENNIEKAD